MESTNCVSPGYASHCGDALWCYTACRVSLVGSRSRCTLAALGFANSHREASRLLIYPTSIVYGPCPLRTTCMVTPRVDDVIALRVARGGCMC